MAGPRSALYTVMLVTLLGTAGIALPYPVLSPFFLEGGHDNAMIGFAGIHPKLLLGCLLALYPLGLLVGSTFIGALSDSFGRRRVLVVTLLGAAATYGLSGYAVLAESYLLFALSRLLTGLFEGNIAVSRAIALELHPAIDRARSMSLVFASTYAGWLVGPLAGGYLMPLGVDMVFFSAGGVTLLAIAVVMLSIPRDRGDLRDDADILQVMRKDHSLSLLRVASIRTLLLFHFLYTFGLNAYYEFYPLWLVERFSFTSQQIGWSTVVITLAMIVSSVYLNTPLNRRLGSLATVLLGVSLLSLALMALPLATRALVQPAFFVIGVLIAISNGLFPAYMSERFHEQGQGRVMGLLTTSFCAANVIAAFAGSFIALLGTGWSIFSGGLLCLLAAAWLYFRGMRHR